MMVSSWWLVLRKLCHDAVMDVMMVSAVDVMS